MVFFSFSFSSFDLDTKILNLEEIFEKADQLHTAYETCKLYELLKPYENCENDELLWRLSRAAYDKAKREHNKEMRKTYMYESFGYAKRALTLNESNYACHKVRFLISFFFL